MSRSPTLNKESPVPLYVQLKQLIEQWVSSGELHPHARVPSERELSDRYGISRMTARQALAELIAEGRLYSRPGKGTFVAESKISQNIQSLTSFTEDMQARGLVPTTRLLSRVLLAPPPAVAQALQIPEHGEVVRVERLRLADGMPMALETSYLSFPGVERLLALPLEGSLYALLRSEFDIVPVEALQEFEATTVGTREAALLQLPEYAPVLTLRRLTLDATNHPFEYVESVYRGDRYRFVARLIRNGAA